MSKLEFQRADSSDYYCDKKAADQTVALERAIAAYEADNLAAQAVIGVGNPELECAYAQDGDGLSFEEFIAQYNE